MIFVFMGEMGGVNTKILFLVKICLGKIIFGETFVGKIFGSYLYIWERWEV